MCNKKGFILIETIVTITVLSVALLYIYGSFSDILIKEKTRVYYDDVAYIYRSYHVKEFLMNQNLQVALNNLNENNPLIIIGCEYSGLINNYDKINQCSSIISMLNITRMAVAQADLSYINSCDDSEAKCDYLNFFSQEEVTYLNTLGDLGDKAEYVMIFEYVEELDDERVERNYAWIGVKGDIYE